MILILCNDVDEVALRLHGKLRDRSPDALLVTAADLLFAPYWRHMLTADGLASTEIRLLNGTVIRSEEVQAAYSRLSYPQAVHFLNETDKAYAEMEFHALLLSFLHSLGGALPAPLASWQITSEGWSSLQLQAAAMEAGLPVLDSFFTTSPRWKRQAGMIPMAPVKAAGAAFYRKSPHLLWEDRPVRQVGATTAVIKATVAGGRVFSDRPLPCEEALLHFALILGALLLDVFLGETPQGAWAFYAADTSPAIASDAAITAISEALLHKTMIEA